MSLTVTVRFVHFYAKYILARLSHFHVPVVGKPHFAKFKAWFPKPYITCNTKAIRKQARVKADKQEVEPRRQQEGKDVRVVRRKDG